MCLWRWWTICNFSPSNRFYGVYSLGAYLQFKICSLTLISNALVMCRDRYQFSENKQYTIMGGINLYSFYPKSLRVLHLSTHFFKVSTLLTLYLISKSIPRGLCMFYASTPSIVLIFTTFTPNFHMDYARSTRLFHVSTSTTFTPNFHIYSM